AWPRPNRMALRVPRACVREAVGPNRLGPHGAHELGRGGGWCPARGRLTRGFALLGVGVPGFWRLAPRCPTPIGRDTTRVPVHRGTLGHRGTGHDREHAEHLFAGPDCTWLERV